MVGWYWSVGEMLCPKMLLQFSSVLNETCYTWSLWCVYVHDKSDRLSTDYIYFVTSPLTVICSNSLYWYGNCFSFKGKNNPPFQAMSETNNVILCECFTKEELNNKKRPETVSTNTTQLVFLVLFNNSYTLNLS